MLCLLFYKWGCYETRFPGKTRKFAKQVWARARSVATKSDPQSESGAAGSVAEATASRDAAS
ncbi:hypothetical protein [Posidoniimonas corsicana]|uniref:hypothetical protein n=1 Tax=Posidoniimonas corsicana TaxID=1938618 RepID=UPI0011B7ECCC|nr:hypothetical protein [Posidoniimonas corsicana]